MFSVCDKVLLTGIRRHQELSSIKSEPAPVAPATTTWREEWQKKPCWHQDQCRRKAGGTPGMEQMFPAAYRRKKLPPSCCSTSEHMSKLQRMESPRPGQMSPWSPWRSKHCQELREEPTMVWEKKWKTDQWSYMDWLQPPLLLSSVSLIEVVEEENRWKEGVCSLLLVLSNLLL